MNKKIIFLIALFSILFAVPCYAKAVKGSLEADDIKYNVNTQQAHAEGNVIFTRGMDELKGDVADGTINSSVTVTGSPVRGNFPSRKSKLVADKVVWTADKTQKTDGTIECFGKVFITNEPKNFLKAVYVKANTKSNDYDATGNVDMLYNGRYLKSDEAHRHDNDFSALNVIKLEDRIKKYDISAKTIRGKLNDKDEITSAIAETNVVFNYIDKDGLKSRITGSQAVYTKETGSLIITGRPHAVREDGKTIDADKLIYNEKTKQIDAIGNSKITFVMDEKDSKKNNKVK